MKARLSFVDRIKALLRVFHDDNVALNNAVSHEIEFLPSSTPESKRDARFAIARAMQPRNQVGGLLVSSESNRIWSANQKSDKGGAQTPSNLG
jgi:hypothetical protein